MLWIVDSFRTISVRNRRFQLHEPRLLEIKINSINKSLFNVYFEFRSFAIQHSFTTSIWKWYFAIFFDDIIYYRFAPSVHARCSMTWKLKIANRNIETRNSLDSTFCSHAQQCTCYSLVIVGLPITNQRLVAVTKMCVRVRTLNAYSWSISTPNIRHLVISNGRNK